MSSGEPRRDGSECSQESSDSDSGSQPNSSRVQGKPKRADKTYTTWKFRDTIQADFSGLGSLGERRQKLIEHFQTRTSLERPLCVRSVTFFAQFADLDQIVLDAPRSISITIIGYVQTKSSRKSTLTNWIKSANWEPIPAESPAVYSATASFSTTWITPKIRQSPGTSCLYSANWV